MPRTGNTRPMHAARMGSAPNRRELETKILPSCYRAGATLFFCGKKMPDKPAVIFDVEGTLVHCVTETLAAWRYILSENGHLFADATLHEFSGMDGDLMLRRLLPGASDTERHRLIEQQGEHYRRNYLKSVKAFSGVDLVFAALAPTHLLALATTCDKAELETYLALTKVSRFLSVQVCGDDAERGKPAPDLIVIAQHRLRVQNSIVVGDTPYDAQAATAAGAVAVGVETGGFSAAALRKAGCVAVVRNVGEVPSLLGDIAIQRKAPRSPL
jgi:phosphoglycolate phosphatase-like HAD superfamily hydrolase